MRLVAHHEVPFLRCYQPSLHIGVAAEHVEAGDKQVVFGKRIAGSRRFKLVSGEDVERQAELLVKLVLPLLHEATRRNDEAAFQVTANGQFLDEKTGHNCLPRTGIVGKQESQRLARQHLAVDGRNLVRQRLDARGVDGKVGIEQMGEPDAVGFRNKPKQMPIGIKRPWPASRHDFQARFFVAIDQPVLDRSGRVLERDLDGLVAKPLDLNDLC